MAVPSRVFLQLVEHGQVAVFEHEVQLLLAAEHFDEVHQIGVLELLAEGKIRLKSIAIRSIIEGKKRLLP